MLKVTETNNGREVNLAVHIPFETKQIIMYGNELVYLGRKLNTNKDIQLQHIIVQLKKNRMQLTTAIKYLEEDK